MKRILTFLSIIVLALVLTIGVFASEAETPKVVQPGDVNADGVIDTKDAVLLAQYLAKWDVQLGGDSHTVVIDEAVEPTCKTTGLTEGKHCSDCGMILVKQRIIPTTDHDFEETFVNPTTNSDGYTLCKCTVCGHEEKKNFVPAVNSNGLEIEVDTTNKTCVITGIGTCEDTDINIPEKISEYTVVGIADKAFSEQTQITSVTIPKTVKNLGQRAFYGCTGLTEFTIPASVTSVGHQIFYKCDNLTTVYYNSSFTPASDKYFLNIPSIKTVVFGNIEKIPNYICYNSNVENVIIFESITSIGNSAFYNCSDLKSIKIADSVKSIEEWAFYGCYSLKDLYVSDLESWLNVDLGNNYSYPIWYGGNLYINGVLATTIEIPNIFSSINSYQFRNCDSIISVIIPDSVTSIGGSAFYGCSSLTSVTIPDSVTSIGDWAFENCSSLTTVYYGGDAIDWDGISIGYSNSKLTNATRYYYSETEPTSSGNYWHYVDGKSTPW